MNRWTRAILGRPFDRAREAAPGSPASTGTRAGGRAPADGLRGARELPPGSDRPPRTQAQAYFDQGCGSSTPSITLEAESGVPRGDAHRSRLRDVLLGHRAQPGVELQQPDRRRAGANRLRGRSSRPLVPGRPRHGPRERATIEALAKRHADHADDAERAELDRAYADAMRQVARRFPDDLDAATLFADALMNLRPWNLWKPDGSMQPETQEILETLERVLRANPDHPGALHLYIHAVEGGPTPDAGEAAADRLGPLMPGAGHIVHMPSHIYLRDRPLCRRREVERRGGEGRPRVLGEGPDEPHASWALLPAQPRHASGRRPAWTGAAAETIRAAREFAESVPPTMLREMSGHGDGARRALLRLGALRALGGDPPPARAARRSSRTSTGAWRYSRGLAFIATGTPDRGRGRAGRAPAARQHRAARAAARRPSSRPRRSSTWPPTSSRGDRRADGPDRRGGPAPARRGGGAGWPLVHRAARSGTSRSGSRSARRC